MLELEFEPVKSSVVGSNTFVDPIELLLLVVDEIPPIVEELLSKGLALACAEDEDML